MEVITQFFDDRIISKELKPPHSSDLLIQDFSLWGYLKNFTFTNNSYALDELKSNTLHAKSDIISHTSHEVPTAKIREEPPMTLTPPLYHLCHPIRTPSINVSSGKNSQSGLPLEGEFNVR
ncbi:uncharacterized protein TNCV_3000451 [Trichonephila clavipes]|nr:uncharacterized protein TNCV_3000451 [Trichonephila clavipes]